MFNLNVMLTQKEAQAIMQFSTGNMPDDYFNSASDAADFKGAIETIQDRITETSCSLLNNEIINK